MNNGIRRVKDQLVVLKKKINKVLYASSPVQNDVGNLK